MSEGTRSLRSVPFRENYSSSGSSLLNEFYIPALSNAVRYDRATGYFSSAVLALAPVAFSEFATRGGKMRLLCSPHLSEADAQAILCLAEMHQPTTLEVAAASLASLVHGTHLETRAVACLRALVNSGVLEIRFVSSGRSGLFHDKLGIFTDEYGDKVSFIGSANETAAAWSGFVNHEQIEAFRSWTGETDERRCSRHEDQFDETWEGLRRGLVVTSSVEASGVIHSIVPSQPPDEIVASLREAVDRAELQPDAIPLRDYQSEVIRSWELSDYRGIIAFATGGGKTRTALEAVRLWTTRGRPALILVPSELLHKQWASEIEALVGNATVLFAGAGFSRDGWSRRLADYTRDDSSLGQRIVVSTYQTAATDRFLELVRTGPHLLVVADEVHRIGALDTRRILNEIPAGGRLGLSATPERFGDPAGTTAINAYFGSVLTPEFTLRDALDAQVLVPYDYDFVTCHLTEDEEFKWNTLSVRVAKELSRSRGEITESALQLLRQRARISKRAEGKAAIARTVLADSYRPGDRWLVYCSDVGQLGDVRRELEGLGVDVLEYHSQDAGNHGATLSFFTNRGGVLLAIKCLDEGIDIPLINRALILASSTNPREYIQRRGRVLRRTPGKYSARIFDVLVVGNDGKAITPSEVVRAIEFARDSRNVGPALYLQQMLPASPDWTATDPPDIEEDQTG